MKKSSHIREIYKLTGLSTLDFPSLDEGAFKNFLKSAKKKYFTDTKFVGIERANEIKYIFAYVLINALTQIKFKFSFVKYQIDPNKLIKVFQKDLLEIIEKNRKEIIKPVDILKLEDYYSENTSLADECLEILDNIESYILKELNNVISKTYRWNRSEQQSESYKKLFIKIKDIFELVFAKGDDVGLSAFPRNSKFRNLAYKVIGQIKSQTSREEFPIDIESSYIIDDSYFSDETDLDDKILMDAEQIKKEVSKLTYSYFITVLRLYSSKYKVVIRPAEHESYIKLIKAVYEELLVEYKDPKRITKYMIVDRLASMMSADILVGGIGVSKEEEKK